MSPPGRPADQRDDGYGGSKSQICEFLEQRTRRGRGAYGSRRPRSRRSGAIGRGAAGAKTLVVARGHLSVEQQAEPVLAREIGGGGIVLISRNASAMAVEPADTWSTRVPAKYRDRAPHIVPRGRQRGLGLRGHPQPDDGLNATAGKAEGGLGDGADHLRRHDPGLLPARGHGPRTWPPRGRSWPSVAFPTLPRFGAPCSRASRTRNSPSVCVRAWNDFMFDWCSVAPQDVRAHGLIQLWDRRGRRNEIERCSTGACGPIMHPRGDEQPRAAVVLQRLLGPDLRRCAKRPAAGLHAHRIERLAVPSRPPEAPAS